MAEAAVTKRYKEIHLQVHPHDITIQFFKHAFPKPKSFPPVYLQLTRRSLSLSSSEVALRESPEGSGTYVACWKKEVLSLMVNLQRENDSDKFEKMELKFFLKVHVCSKGKLNHEILGSCSLDISRLKLETLEFASKASERRQLMFHFPKNAIKSVTLVATFQYEAAKDNSSSPTRNPTMKSLSVSPQSACPWPLKTSKDVVGSYMSTIAFTAASSKSESELVASPTVNVQYTSSLASRLSSKSKAEKLRSAFQFHRIKSTWQYSRHQKSVRNHQKRRGVPRMDEKPLTMHDRSCTTFEARKEHDLDTEVGIVQHIVHSPTKRSTSSVQCHSFSLEKLPSESVAAYGHSVQKANLSRPSDVPDESKPCYHPSTQDEQSDDTSEHRRENSTSVSSRAEPARQEQEQEKSAENDPLPPKQRIGATILPPVHLVSEPNTQPNKSRGSDSENEWKREAAVMEAGLTAVTFSSTEDLASQNFEEERQGVPAVIQRRKSCDAHIVLPRVPRKYSEPPLPVSPVDLENYRKRSNSSTPHGNIGMNVDSRRKQSPRMLSLPQQLRKTTNFSSSPSLAAESQGAYLHSKATIATDTSGATSARNMAPSMVDLIKPVRRSLPENPPVSRSHFPATDTFGILKVRVTAVHRGESEHFSHQVLTELALNPEKSIMLSNQMAEPPSESMYCVLTINGGNTRAETLVQPILSNRPVMWEDPKEMLFYAKKTQQVFIMCRKTMVNTTTDKSACNSQTATSEDTCTGAAILPLSVLEDSTSTQIAAGDICQTLKQLKFIPKSLPLQPKGSVLLQASFFALQPRFRVSCKGTVTVDRLLHVDCNPNHELCCSARVDEDIQGCTSVLAIEDYSKDGWVEEPMHFEAHGNYDYSIHIWAYSPDETEYWCGGCTLPLGLILPKNIMEDPTVTSHCVVKESCKSTIILPVEPQGEVSLSFTIQPLSKDELLAVEEESIQTDGEAQPDLLMSSTGSAGRIRGNATELHSLSRKSLLRATRRKNRSFATDTREKSFAVCVKSAYVEKSLPLEKENIDLKKEVEYLREELCKTKAKLAEQQFFHEKTLLELRALREQLPRDQLKVSIVKKKRK